MSVPLNDQNRCLYLYITMLCCCVMSRECIYFFFFSSRRRHTRFDCDWSSDVCSSDLQIAVEGVYDPVAIPIRLGHVRFAADAARIERVGVANDIEPVSPPTLAVMRQIGRASCRERV